MPRAPGAAAAPLLLLLALLLAAAPPHGGSESPKGKQKALRQREVVDVVRAAGPGTGSGAGGGVGGAVRAGGGWRSHAAAFFLQRCEKAIDQRLLENLAAAPGRAAPVPRCWASPSSANYTLVVLNQENAERRWTGSDKPRAFGGPACVLVLSPWGQGRGWRLGPAEPALPALPGAGGTSRREPRQCRGLVPAARAAPKDYSPSSKL